MFNDQSEIIHCSYIDDLSDKLHARVSESDEHNSANSFVERNNSYEDSDKFSSIFVFKNEIEMLDGKRCNKIRKLITGVRVLVRDICIVIITSSIFEAISLTVIIVNSFAMALEDPSDGQSTGGIFYILDYIFLGLYTLEMILKIFGMGFILPKGSYLRDSWNILDFIIVVSGYIPMVVASGSTNLNVLRSFRVLRPLRTISGIEGLRTLVSTLLSAIPLLRDTILVLTFFFIIFAIAGLQLWSGVLKRRCISELTGMELVDGEL